MTFEILHGALVLLRGLEDERYRSEDHGRKKGLEVHRPRLSSHARPLHGVTDPFGARIHVAPTARGQPHSRLVARLEVSHGGKKQRHEKP